MIKGKNLSNGFWAEVISTIVYLKNIIRTRCLDIKAPFEALYVLNVNSITLEYLVIDILHTFLRKIGRN